MRFINILADSAVRFLLIDRAVAGRGTYKALCLIRKTNSIP